MPHEIVVGVTGGIAAYKTAALVSDLVQDGNQISVVMTRSARKFVGPATFRALTGRPVCTDIFERRSYPLGAHIELSRQARLLCVAPATADFLAKAAHGMADDLLSTLLLSFTGPVLVAPAMNAEMWAKSTVQRNLTQIRDDGLHVIDPGEGWLSCRQEGIGRMAEPEEIKTVIDALLSNEE